MTRPLFCGNFEYDARTSEIERLFAKYGKVNRVDMKTGFAFVYMEDDKDAEDAIHELDNTEQGRKGRRLSVEWARERDVKRPLVQARPAKTLFVVNFDPLNVRIRQVEKHFEVYGKIARVNICRNYAFVEFELQEDADKAVSATNGSELEGRVITVEYAVREDGNPSGSFSTRPRRYSPPPLSPYSSRNSGRRRSPDYARYRKSPDYGRYSSRSPLRRHRSRSPNYHPYRH